MTTESINETDLEMLLDAGGDDFRIACFSKNLYYNFIFFCVFFSITHATVDAVLAFATAELGASLGGYSGFMLYIFYTITALLFVKPFLRLLHSKYGVQIGMLGFLIYVATFLLATMSNKPELQYPIFLIGSSLGGIGAGLLWTSQGSYYSSNALKYALYSKQSPETVKNDFSALFASFYLSFETLFKAMATVIFVNKSKLVLNWKLIVFGLYTVAAFISFVLFSMIISSLQNLQSQPQNSEDSPPSSPHSDDNTSLNRVPVDNAIKRSHSSSSILPRPSILSQGFKSNRRTLSWHDFFGEASAVTHIMMTVYKLQLLLPYQISFGLQTGFIDFYINRQIVSKYVGEGYIGILTAITTLSAVLVSWPFAKLSNRYQQGKYFVMIFGGCCFLFNGLSLIIMSDEQIGHWPYLILYFAVHGAARGVWESTNKAVILDYFPEESSRDSAYASIYFTSGLAGAFGFMVYQFMPRIALALLNTLVPVISIVGYHISSRIIDDITRPSSSSDDINPQSDEMGDTSLPRNPLHHRHKDYDKLDTLRCDDTDNEVLEKVNYVIRP